MGVIDKVKKSFSSRAAKKNPLSASFATRPDTIYAPVSGLLVSMQEVHDESMASGLFGQGYGIIPVGNGVVYAPCDARVGATTVTNHAIGLSTESGLEIIIHIGLGTVNMKGKGFERFVESNQYVKAGQPIMSFDSQEIRSAGLEDIVTCVVSNSDCFDSIQYIGESSTLLGDYPLVKIGDPLLVVRPKKD